MPEGAGQLRQTPPICFVSSMVEFCFDLTVTKVRFFYEAPDMSDPMSQYAS